MKILSWQNIAAFAVGVLFSMLALKAHADDATVIGQVDTTWRLVNNDKVVIKRFDDPKVKNASCYVSYAQTGGVSGLIGLAEDPSRFSIACRATGPVSVTGNINKSADGEIVFDQRSSALFKTMRVTRFLDADKNVLVYLVWSTKAIDGSPFNSVTAIPLASQ